MIGKELFVIKNGRFGKLVCANKFFEKGQKILDFSGPVLLRSELPENIATPEDDRFLQVGINLFIGPSGGVDDLINHSCEPNSAVMIKDKNASLFAIKDIQSGDEITYDYSLQMNDEQWTMQCRCGAKCCRLVIKEYRFIPESLKDHYLKLGFVPDYNRGL